MLFTRILLSFKLTDHSQTDRQTDTIPQCPQPRVERSEPSECFRVLVFSVPFILRKRQIYLNEVVACRWFNVW